jgi:hypothetical protein
MLRSHGFGLLAHLARRQRDKNDLRFEASVVSEKFEPLLRSPV